MGIALFKESSGFSFKLRIARATMDYGVCTEMHIVHPGSGGDGRHASLEDHVEPLLRGEMSRYRVNAAAGGGAPPPPPPPGQGPSGRHPSPRGNNARPPPKPPAHANVHKYSNSNYNPQDVNGAIGSHMSNTAIRRKGGEIKKMAVKDASKDVEWADDLGNDLDAIKFAPVQIKDKFALSMFILQLLSIIVVFVTVWSNGEDVKVMDTTLNKITALKVFASSCAFAFVFSGVWLMLLKIFIRKAVLMTFAMAILILGTVAGIAASQGQVGWAIFWGIILFVFGYYFYLIRKRIKFATLMLKAAMNVVFQFKSTLLVAYGALLVQCMWLMFWAFCYLTIWPYFGNNPFIGAGLLMSLFWTAQVIKNVVHVTVAGTTAYWYFCYDCMPPNPTGKALFRTLTINLGSISMGSMITSIIKTLRVILEGLRRSNDGNPSFTVIMAGFTLKWIECIARYFNSYAFTYIAIYGKNFTASAKKTWDLIQNCGLDAIINDDIIGGTIMFSACIVAALTGFCGAFWAVHSGIENWFWGVGFPCALVGFVLGVVTFNVVESAVLSIYVCFAEDPDALYYNDRDLYEKLTDAQEMGVLADIDSDSSTESDDTSLGDFTTSEDEEDMLDKDNFDDLTPEQLAEISSDDEEQGLLDEDEKKKKKKWYQRVGGAVGSAVGGIVGFFSE